VIARLALVATVLALIGCPKRPAAPPLPPEVVEVQVSVHSDEGSPPPPLDLAALTRLARAGITQSSGLVVREDGGTRSGDVAGARYKLRVEVDLGLGRDDKAKKGAMRALVQARLRPVGAELGALSFEQSAVAERVFDLDKAGEPAWQAHVERAIGDVLAGVGARVKLAAGDVHALVAALDSSDEDLRQEGMRLAAERRESATVPGLIKLLKTEDHATRDRAIGALAAIGDKRAVRPLTEAAHFRDIIDLPKVLDALATIGGPEARSYLVFVASGHESPEIRDLAKQALGHLDRREREAQRDLGAVR
jgi:hypothetical protein